MIGAQELFSADRRTAAQQAMARQGWATVVGADSAVPIFYNATKYKILAHDTVKGFDVTRIEPGASGTSIGSWRIHDHLPVVDPARKRADRPAGVRGSWSGSSPVRCESRPQGCPSAVRVALM